MKVVNLGGECRVCRIDVRSSVMLDFGQGTSPHTGEGLKGSCRLLLEFFSEVIREEEVVNVSLVA